MGRLSGDALPGDITWWRAWRLLLASPLPRPARPRGVAVGRAAQPGLDALVRDTAAVVGQAAPRRYLLTATAAVTVHGRRLAIGLPLLTALPSGHLAALVAYALSVASHPRPRLVRRLFARWTAATAEIALAGFDRDGVPDWAARAAVDLALFDLFLASEEEGMRAVGPAERVAAHALRAAVADRLVADRAPGQGVEEFLLADPAVVGETRHAKSLDPAAGFAMIRRPLRLAV